jgi:DNA mismatch endonuclease (patch repair protein)
MMAGIRGKDTKPELAVRRALHARGFRYRLHAKNLPGRPDVVLSRYRAAIFVHGCFWHGHDCPMFRLPGTRTDYWRDKIRRNRERDHEVSAALEAMSWRRLTVWECALRGPGRLPFDSVIEEISFWIKGMGAHLNIRGAA